MNVFLTRIASIAIALVVSAVTVSTAHAGAPRLTGFVKIQKDREIFVDFLKPEAGRPIVVLLNGLTYRLGCWDDFTEELKGEGLGILRFDFKGQGETLKNDGIPPRPIQYKDQVEDLARLLRALGIDRPVHLVSLSYGGAIALEFSVRHPELTESLVLMAPFVEPLKKQDDWIKLQIQQTRILYPANPASYDDLYDYFLRQIVYTTYPAAEPIVLEHPYKLEATLRLVQGVRKFDYKDIVANVPTGKVHLVVARQDQYVENSVHEEFWSKLAESQRASRLFIEGSGHKIPEDVPAFAARWVRMIVSGDPRTSDGRSFIATPKQAGSGRDSIKEIK